LPDHGEVWSLPWEAEEDSGVLRLTTHGVRLPYRLEKSIRLMGHGTIRFDYEVANPTSFPMPFLWSSHPLFAVRPGMRLELPVTSMRVFSAPAFSAHHGDLIPWPCFNGLDLSCVLQPDAGVAVKLFSSALSAGWTELSDPADGAAVRFEFDPTLVTHLGLWINYGGWAGVLGAAPYFNLGLEPCIGAPDTLDTAVDHWRAYGELPPRSCSAWWLEMTVS
jgi:galactose mutarotase-like enzyme